MSFPIIPWHTYIHIYQVRVRGPSAYTSTNYLAFFTTSYFAPTCSCLFWRGPEQPASTSSLVHSQRIQKAFLISKCHLTENKSADQLSPVQNHTWLPPTISICSFQISTISKSPSTSVHSSPHPYLLYPQSPAGMCFPLPNIKRIFSFTLD